VSTQRIYVVRPTSGDTKPRLIRATHPSNALSYVANSQFTVAVAKPDDLVELLTDGVSVKSVAQEQQQIPTT
jgi:hypothetical protein